MKRFYRTALSLILTLSMALTMCTGMTVVVCAETETSTYKADRLTVYEKEFQETAATEKLTLTRSEMEALDEAGDFYYGGFDSKPQAFEGRADKSADLLTLLQKADVKFVSGDNITFKSAEGQEKTFSYKELYGAGRYYFPFLYTGTSWAAKSNSKSVSQPHIVISGVEAVNSSYAEGESIDKLAVGDANAYQLAFGITMDEFSLNEDASPAIGALTQDGLVSHIVSITVEHAQKNTADVQQADRDNYEGIPQPSVLESADKWDGESIDISWYIDKEDETEYVINTAAQLAGVAALVNGLINGNCNVYTGTETIAASKWNDSSYVKNATGTHGACNRATDDYSFGVETFEGKKISLSADLDMSAGNYMPIGGQYMMKAEDTNTKLGASFCGVFDGCGHYVKITCDRISELNYGDGECIGLIGRIGVADFDTKESRPSGAGVYNVGVLGNITGNRCVAGVVGKIGKTSGGAVIENCVNYAEITGSDAKGTGGICGAAWNGGSIRNCYNAGNVKNKHGSYGGIAGSDEILLENCYSIGRISGIGYSAGISTSNGRDSYKNCCWLDISADLGVFDKEIEQVVRLTSFEMKSAEFVSRMGNAYAADSGNINGGYPVLSWQLSDVIGENVNESTAGKISYIDVAESAWYAEAVSYATEKGLMNGTGEGMFSPKGTLSRAMLVTILYRMETQTAVSGSALTFTAAFSDVADDSWYADSVAWASAKGIVKGYEDNTFQPTSVITRQEMASVFYRYEQYKGGGFTGSWMFLLDMADREDISEWAYEAACWMSMNGIITGKSEGGQIKYDPAGSATRAEAAAIIQRYCELK